MSEIPEFEILEEDVEESNAEKRNSRVACWVGTWNNPSMTDEEFEKFFQELDEHGYLQYAVFQREKGEETGTIHFQFFVNFKNARYFTWVKKTLPYGCHFKPMRSTKTHCKDYCSKEDTRVSGPYEIGDFIEERGRSDLVKARDMLKQGATFDEVADIYVNQCLMYERQLKAYQDRLIKKEVSRKFRDVKVTYIYGPPRTGKTTYVYETLGFDLFMVDCYDKSAFTEYDNNKAIVLDEYNSDFNITFMNRLLDRYPLQLRGLGCVKWASFEEVYIISNLPLSEQYKKVQEERPVIYQAFKERIGRIIRFDEYGVMHTEKDKYNNVVQLEIKEDYDIDEQIFGD